MVMTVNDHQTWMMFAKLSSLLVGCLSTPSRPSLMSFQDFQGQGIRSFSLHCEACFLAQYLDTNITKIYKKVI